MPRGENKMSTHHYVLHPLTGQFKVSVYAHTHCSAMAMYTHVRQDTPLSVVFLSFFPLRFFLPMRYSFLGIFCVWAICFNTPSTKYMCALSFFISFWLYLSIRWFWIWATRCYPSRPSTSRSTSFASLSSRTSTVMCWPWWISSGAFHDVLR